MRSYIQSKKALLATAALCGLALVLVMMMDVRKSAVVPLPASPTGVPVTAVSRQGNLDPPKTCEYKFVKYIPSTWESEWTNDLENRKFKVCEYIVKPSELPRAQVWLDTTIELMRLSVDDEFKHTPAMDEVFSKMQYEYVCPYGVSDPLAGTMMESMIEPLVGNTRDPYTVCDFPADSPVRLNNRTGWDFVQSKRHLLMGPYALMRFKKPSDSHWGSWNVSPRSILPEPSQLIHQNKKKVILFDLGAALFGAWGSAIDAASTKYFVEYWWFRRGMNMAAIYAYEYTVYKPTQVWESVPDEVMPFYHYINCPVSDSGKFNPLNILKAVAKPEDYVIIKLDIDTPHLENALVQQITTDPTLYGLIDEMTYEHHVHTAEMLKYWGNIDKSLNLAETYKNFLFLRNHGVRMHSWP